MKDIWRKVSQANAVLRFFHFFQIAVPFVIAGWATYSGIAEKLPLAGVIAFTALALAGMVLFVNQLRMLLNVPVTVKVHSDISFGLAFDSIVVAYNQNPEHGGLQLGLILVNSSREPIHFDVERFTVIIGNTTMPQHMKNMVNTGLTIPLGGRRSFKDHPIPMSSIAPLLGGSHAGELEAHFVYGRAGQKHLRRYKVTLALAVHLGEQIGVGELVKSESDEALIPSA